MTFWERRPSDTDNLRLYVKGHGWRSSRDEKDDNQQVVKRGSEKDIEEALTGALNASHLVLLTGAGSSFSATNAEPTAKRPPSMEDLWAAVLDRATQTLIDSVVTAVPSSAAIVSNKNIEKLLTHCKMYVELFGENGEANVANFVSIAEIAIEERVDFVDENTSLVSHQELIRKIARRGIRKPRARVFTTNYDLAYEYAARSLRFTLIDGFSHSMPQVYDRDGFSHDIVRRHGEREGPDYVENVFHLHKLHGSIDWRRKAGDLIRSRDATDGPAALIYPRDSKYQEAFTSPFIDMMSAFQSAIRTPDTALIVSGFGFNDDHITEPLLAAVEANLTLRLVVCDVAFLSSADLEAADHEIATSTSVQRNLTFDKLRKLIEIGDERITLINGRFEDLASAMPDLVAQTERERHVERLRILKTETDIRS